MAQYLSYMSIIRGYLNEVGIARSNRQDPHFSLLGTTPSLEGFRADWRVKKPLPMQASKDRKLEMIDKPKQSISTYHDIY